MLDEMGASTSDTFDYLDNNCFYLIWPIAARDQALRIFEDTLTVDFSEEVFLHQLPQSDVGTMDFQEPSLRFDTLAPFLQQFERMKYMGIHFEGSLGKLSALTFHWEATPHVVVLRVGYRYGLLYEKRLVPIREWTPDMLLFFKEVERIGLAYQVPYIFFQSAYKSELLPTPAQWRMHQGRLEIDLSVLNYDGGHMDRLWVASDSLPPINFPLSQTTPYSEHYACYPPLRTSYDVGEPLDEFYYPYVEASGYPLAIPECNPVQSHFIQRLQHFVRDTSTESNTLMSDINEFLVYRLPYYTVFEEQLRFILAMEELVFDTDYETDDALRASICQAFQQHFGYALLDYVPQPHEIEAWRFSEAPLQ